MSNDSKLQNINAIMIMKEEHPSSIHPQGQVLVHEQDLEYQQKDLFWAFAKGDEHYIYPFDTETLKKREHFVSKAFQIGLTGAVTLGAANYLFAKQIRPQAGYSNGVKFALLAASNIVPLTILSYQGVKLYNKTNDFLYERYLKPSIERTQNEKWTFK